jgi:uncharacterized protein YegP (UPF0339 family)
MPHRSLPSPFRNGTPTARGSGTFELVRADGGRVLIRLLDGAGALLAVSESYQDVAAAVKGIETMREYAATSHISDRTALPRSLP